MIRPETLVRWHRAAIIDPSWPPWAPPLPGKSLLIFASFLAGALVILGHAPRFDAVAANAVIGLRVHGPVGHQRDLV
jgi:hypothetical protein